MDSVANRELRRDASRNGSRCGAGTASRAGANFASGTVRVSVSFAKMGMEFPETAVTADDSCRARKRTGYMRRFSGLGLTNLTVLGVSAALAGCTPTTQADRAQFIEAPRMERTIAASGVVSAGRDRSWPREEWWRGFKNADLNRIVDKALSDNQNLRKANDTLAEADAVVRVAQARLLPALQADALFRQSRVPFRGVVASYNLGQGDLYKTSAFLTPLVMTWEVDFWGKNRAAMEAAIGEAAAQEGELEQTRLLLTAGVVRAWARGYAFAQQAQIASELTRLRRELRTLAETRYRTGLDTLDGVAAAQANEETAIRREATTNAALALQQDAIARMMGEGPDAAQGLFAGKKGLSPALPPIPKHLPIELLAHRPDLAAALRRAEAAAQRIHIAKTMFLPSLDLSAAAGLEATTTTTRNLDRLSQWLFDGRATGFAILPGVRLPLFQAGRLAGNLDVQRTEYDQAVDSYNETLLQAAQQVADALANMKRANTEYAAQQRFVRANQAQLDLAGIRLRDGLRDRRELVQERVDLLEAAFAQRSLEGERLVAAVDLFQALGGGYSDGPDPAAPKPAPEDDPITPVVDTIKNVTGG